MLATRRGLSETSGFLRDVDDICALRGYYAASSGNPLQTFRGNIGPIFKGEEEVLGLLGR